MRSINTKNRNSINNTQYITNNGSISQENISMMLIPTSKRINISSSIENSKNIPHDFYEIIHNEIEKISVNPRNNHEDIKMKLDNLILYVMNLKKQLDSYSSSLIDKNNIINHPLRQF